MKKKKKKTFQCPFLNLEEDIFLKEAVDNQEPAEKETEVRLW